MHKLSILPKCALIVLAGIVIYWTIVFLFFVCAYSAFIGFLIFMSWIGGLILTKIIRKLENKSHFIKDMHILG